jgi:O-antigen/teichoic acid export membrane protein
MFPAYSTLSHDLSALRHGFLKVLGLIALLAIPAGLGMASVAHLFVPVVLGDKWHAATPVIEILAVAGAIFVLQANIESLYFSLGKPRYKAVVTLAEACLFLPLAYYLLPRYGLEGVAGAFLVCASIVVPANFLFATRLIGLRASQALGALWRPLAAGAIMALVVLLAFPPSDVARDVWSNGRALALAILLGASVYAASLTLLWLASGRPAGAEEWVWSQIKPRLGRIAGGSANGT